MHKTITQQLQEGDLLFIAIDSFLYRQVAHGTGSWCSHVGIAMQQNGQWYVAESAIPTVRLTPLTAFLKRAKNQHLAIRRLKGGITQEQTTALKKIIDRYLGVWYHLGFNYDDTRMFCSKFAATAFAHALKIQLGEVETLSQLIAKNPQARLSFWRCWYLGFIPWQRRTITPASLLNDPKLHTVYDNLK